MRVRSLVVTAVALCAALVLAACGQDDFPNNPRPAAPISVSARIGNDGVSVGPSSVGAGQASFTISNQTADAARIVLEGPTDESSDEIVPNGTGSLDVNLQEGDYSVSTGEGGRTTKLVVGPERESSQNQLLLP
ncbi:MAG: hypothetical protein QOI10_1687 [Solirubrobacterales bacterium]|jgi:hypothetical protein|nr:hypothetical protein [Solirubrobacterales bacterium]